MSLFCVNVINDMLDGWMLYNGTSVQFKPFGVVSVMLELYILLSHVDVITVTLKVIVL